MSRHHQTWTCTACGHASTRVVRYPKYGGGRLSETPLVQLAKQARCSACGTRGACRIDEDEPTRLGLHLRMGR